MARIGMKTVQEAGSLVNALLQEHQEEIEEAYNKTEADSISISFSVKIKPGAKGNEINATINFVSERVKDSASGTVDESQLNVFSDGGDNA